MARKKRASRLDHIMEGNQVTRSRGFGWMLGLSVVLLLIFSGPAAAQQSGQGGTAELPQLSFEGLFYLTYQTGESGGEDFSKFAITRSYFTTKADILPMLSARITIDARQDETGDMKARLKYLYGKFDFGDWGGLSKVNLEAGIVHMAWLDFEQKVNPYRMRDKMFMERSGLFNSADIGVTLAGGFGEDLPDEFKEEVNSSYPAKYGSWAVGVYNGGGYSANEKNEDKVVQARVTFRPLPETLPGLQFSSLGIIGEGNRAGEPEDTPDYKVFNLYASYQFPRGVFTAQYVTGEGNQKGSWFVVDDPLTDPLMAHEYDGFSLFGEWKLDANWRLVGGFDDFNRTPEDLDLSFTRVHGGIGYDFGGRNLLLLDLDRRKWDDSDIETDTRAQVVMQVRF